MSSIQRVSVASLLLASYADALVVPTHLGARAAQPATFRLSQRLRMDETAPVPAAFLEARTPYLKNVGEYEAMYKKSVDDPAGFWGDIASQFHWETPYTEVVDANFAQSKGKVFSSWFKGGKTNICYNAVDRHVAAGFGDQVCFFHEGNDEGDNMESWTYALVLDEVQRLANVLKSKGVKKGDCVSIFMPMVPQLPIAMLACARIGAVHSVVFGGFSAEALAGRLIDAQSNVVITANGVMRGAKPIGLFDIVDAASSICEAACVPFESIVLKRLGDDTLPIDMKTGCALNRIRPFVASVAAMIAAAVTQASTLYHRGSRNGGACWHSQSMAAAARVAFGGKKEGKRALENFSDRLPSLLRRSGAACGIRKQTT